MKIFPYIQEQYTDFSPLLSPIGGYAFFVDLMDLEDSIEGAFQVGEQEVSLKQIIVRENSMTLAQESISRSQTAVSGSLSDGEYYLKLRIKDEDQVHKIQFKRSSLKAPIIHIQKKEQTVLASWESSDSTSFWIFALPNEDYSCYSELFKKLKPISGNRYSYSKFTVEKNPFGENIKYRVVVRANTEEIKSGIPRFSKETWGISNIIT